MSQARSEVTWKLVTRGPEDHAEDCASPSARDTKARLPLPHQPAKVDERQRAMLPRAPAGLGGGPGWMQRQRPLPEAGGGGRAWLAREEGKHTHPWRAAVKGTGEAGAGRGGHRVKRLPGAAACPTSPHRPRPGRGHRPWSLNSLRIHTQPLCATPLPALGWAAPSPQAREWPSLLSPRHVPAEVGCPTAGTPFSDALLALPAPKTPPPSPGSRPQ